jgi:hypothetical protein
MRMPTSSVSIRFLLSLTDREPAGTFIVALYPLAAP